MHDLLWLNDLLGFTSNVVGLVSALFAGLAWWKARAIREAQEREASRRAQPISLVLRDETSAERHRLGYRPRRDQATRNEILGILGMYVAPDRFDSSRLIPILESHAFDRMIEGATDEVEIVVESGDFARFVERDRVLGASR